MMDRGMPKSRNIHALTLAFNDQDAERTLRGELKRLAEM